MHSKDVLFFVSLKLNDFSQLGHSIEFLLQIFEALEIIKVFNTKLTDKSLKVSKSRIEAIFQLVLQFDPCVKYDSFSHNL